MLFQRVSGFQDLAQGLGVEGSKVQFSSSSPGNLQTSIFQRKFRNSQLGTQGVV